MASTYYTKDEDGKPKFLMEGIKRHAIFNMDIKFWEACILYKIINMKQSPTSSAFLEGIAQNILSVAFHMNDIFSNKQIIKEVCNKYVQLYKLHDKAQMVNSYLQKIEKEKK
jgi:hypothetical protein